jgi:L,D-transpeptidase-like protein/putative peptidoglycan binding protein
MNGFRLALVVTVSALLLATVTALVYANHREGRLAPDTTIAGVDVGGLKAPAARALLDRRLGAAADEPLTLVRGARRIDVAPGELLARVDSDGLVADALRRGREGNPLGRAIRDVTGRDAGIDLPLRVMYSRAALVGVVDRVQRAIGHPARAADVDFTRRGLRLVPARVGVAVRTAELRRAIVAALQTAGADREIDVPVSVTRRPRRTLGDLRNHYPLLIGISRPGKELRLYRHLRLWETYEIAVGQAGYKTRRGRYKVLSKLKDPVWKPPKEKWVPQRLRGKLVPPGSPDNPIEARWLGFAKGLGIHGTDAIGSLGTRASHGCIRMSVPDVKELFRRVEIGTPIVIV